MGGKGIDCCEEEEAPTCFFHKERTIVARWRWTHCDILLVSLLSFLPCLPGLPSPVYGLRVQSLGIGFFGFLHLGSESMCVRGRL